MLSDVSPWLVIMVLVFLGFILVVFNAKRDSALRAAAYTLVLSIIFIYVLTAHLVPEIRYKLPLPEYPQASADAHVLACCPLPRSSISITQLFCRVVVVSLDRSLDRAFFVRARPALSSRRQQCPLQHLFVLTHPRARCRKFHSLIPADCMVAEQPKVIAYHSKHGRGKHLPLLHPFLPFFSRPSPSKFPSFVPCLVFPSPLARSAHTHAQAHAQAHARVLLA